MLSHNDVNYSGRCYGKLDNTLVSQINQSGTHLCQSTNVFYVSNCTYGRSTPTYQILTLALFVPHRSFFFFCICHRIFECIFCKAHIASFPN